MELPNAAQLKKLAAACRKAGIKSFKGGGIEFTLTDEPIAPQTRRSKSNKPSISYTDDKFESDTLTQEELLFWSAGTPNITDGNEEGSI